MMHRHRGASVGRFEQPRVILAPGYQIDVPPDVLRVSQHAVGRPHEQLKLVCVGIRPGAGEKREPRVAVAMADELERLLNATTTAVLEDRISAC